ncbi:unnamed protein product [Calypogeia fissa]
MERQFQKDKVWFELICSDPVNPIPLTAEVRAEKLKKALYLFSISVRDHIIPVVKKHIDDPKELWQNLKICYESAAMGKQLILWEKLTLVRMSESLGTETYLREIDNLVMQLGNINATVEDNELIRITLNGRRTPMSNEADGDHH